MERNRKYDLTQGGILNRLLLVALPIIGMQFIQMSYNLTDMFLLGRVGGDAVAASAVAGMYMWLSGGLMLIGRMGAEIGVAQNMGRGDSDTAEKYARDSLFVATALGLLYGFVCVAFNGILVDFFRVREPHIALDAKRYLAVVGLAMPMTFVSAAVAGTFNGSGNSRVPFFINATGLGLNVVLDPLFIFALNMGVVGAAVATTIAQTAVCALSLWAVARKKDRPFGRFAFFGVPERRTIAQALRWSLPIAVESVLFTFFGMFISRMTAAYGASALAVYRVGSQIESLCWLTCIGFATALTAFVGQNCGAGKWDRIRACSRVAFVSISAWGALVTLILATMGEALFRLFLPDPVLTEMGGAFLSILALCQIPGCLEAASAGFFRGVGRTLPPSLVSIASNGLRVPLAWALAQGGLGLRGIWVGVTLGAVVRGSWVFLWFVRSFVLKGRPSDSAGFPGGESMEEART